MGMLENLKIWIECVRTGRMNEYKSYKSSLELNKKDIIRFESYIEDCNQRLDDLNKRGYSEDSQECMDVKVQLQRWTYNLDEAKLALQYIRPNSKEDIDYRNSIIKGRFAQELKNVKSDDLDIVFHGTPVYFAREILRSGKILSSADRYDGYLKSSDMAGEISASDIDSLSRTLKFFSDMTAYQGGLPAGCIFAIYPKNKNDFDKHASTMSSVDFKKNPEQLYGIFTTPENVPNVKQWLKEAGLNPNLAYDFEGFLQTVKQTSKGLDGDKFMRVSNDIIEKVEKCSYGEPVHIEENNIEQDNGDRGDN